MATSAGQANGAPFEAMFSTARRPADFHAHVLYRGADGVHRLELRRHRDALLRRDVDGRLTTIATHRAGDPAYRLDLLDHARRIHSVVDRDSLYRQGRFINWTGLAYGLRRPMTSYTIRAAAVRPPLAPVAPCRWYALDASGRRSLICWSAAEAFPLLILDGARQPVWRVTALDHTIASSGLFRADVRGYVSNNAGEDISGD